VNANTFYEKDNTALFVSRHWKVKNSLAVSAEDLPLRVDNKTVIVEGINVSGRHFRNCTIVLFGNSRCLFNKCSFRNVYFETRGRSSISFKNSHFGEANQYEMQIKIDFKSDKHK
jgi:hypothetical protein